MASPFDYDEELGEIPEINLGIRVQPYMYEPLANRPHEDQENSSDSGSDSDRPSDSDETQANNGVPVDEWCSCRQCILMPTVRECRCCQSINEVNEKLLDANLACITSHEGFEANCLNPYVLETSYYEYIQDNGPLGEKELLHEVYRYIAYRRFSRWIWQILGKRNRRVLPACAVTKIRNRFPSPEYCGFKLPK